MAQNLHLYCCMKIALTVWEQRISPVFDVASTVALYDETDGTLIKDIELDFSSMGAFEKVIELAKINTGTIICGAVSRPVSCLAESYGIEIYSFITGEESTVIKAYSEGLITDEKLRMPGCYKRKDRCCRRNNYSGEE